MTVKIAGSWRLVTWRRVIEGGAVSYPLGESPIGTLIYAANGRMAVQMLAADRAKIGSTDALGGTDEERAKAYSTCLAYYGSYEAEEASITHRVEGSLYPNWSETVQVRPYTLDGDELVLRTSPVQGPQGTIVNEIVWERYAAGVDCSR